MTDAQNHELSLYHVPVSRMGRIHKNNFKPCTFALRPFHCTSESIKKH